MKRGRLSRSVKKARRHEAVQPKGIWRVLHWVLERELAFILAGGLFFALLAIFGNAVAAFLGPADILFSLVAVGWIVGVFLCTVLVMDDNPKYRKSGSWICAAVGTLAGGAVAWFCSDSPEWVAAGLALGALLGITRPRWLLHLI